MRLIAIAGFLVGLGWGVHAQQPQHADPAPQRNEQEQPRDDLGATLRAIFNQTLEIFSREKAAGADAEKRKESREESDLSAQWAQTYWAAVAAGSAAISLIVGAITLVFLWRTFKETRRTADAAVDAAEAAHASVKAMEENAHTELRAYVFVKQIVITENEGPAQLSTFTGGIVPGPIISYSLAAELENSGSTPARRVTYCFNAQRFDGDPPSDFDFPNITAPVTTTIGPRASIYTQPISFPHIEMVLVREGHRCLVWGWAEYSDIFDKKPRHRTEFCFEVVVRGWPDSADLELSYRPWGPFNRADGDCIRQPQS